MMAGIPQMCAAALATCQQGITHDFIAWGTKRADWRTLGIRAVGSAVQTLDAIDVI